MSLSILFGTMKFTQFHFSDFLEECSHFVSFTGLCRCLLVLGCVFLWVIVWVFFKCISYNSVLASICMFSLHQIHLDWNVIIAMKKTNKQKKHTLMCLSISRIIESVINVQGKLSMLSMTARIRNKRTMGRACVCVQRAELLKRGAANTPAGCLPVWDVSSHVHSTHTVHILREGLFPQVCCRCGLMCVLTWKDFKQNGMTC